MIERSVQAFYHVACIGDAWKGIVEEQLTLFGSVGLSPAVCMIGSEADESWLKARADVRYRFDDLELYETPTLFVLWVWCRANPDGVTIYAHTKGVSKPDDQRRAAWRRLMGEYVIGDWRKNMPLLDKVDAVGVDWRRGRYFSGNFWMANAGWICKLPSPWKCREDYLAASHKGQDKSREWIANELWLNRTPGIRVVSLCCKKVNFLVGDTVFKLLLAKQEMGNL